MKRLISLVIALVIALSAACCAMAEAKTFKTNYFSLTLPAGWDYDTEDIGVDEDGAEYLGLIGEDKDIGLVAQAYLVYYEDLKDVSLWNAGEDELKDYADSILYDYAEDNPQWIDTVMAGKIPFILIKAADEDGEYLYADTMTNGYSIEFIVFVISADGEKQYPISQKDIDLFKTVLASFQPVS